MTLEIPDEDARPEAPAASKLPPAAFPLLAELRRALWSVDLAEPTGGFDPVLEELITAARAVLEVTGG